MTRSTFLRSPRAMLALVALLLATVAIPAAAQNDISVTSILSPQGGCALSATENVTIRIFNYGQTLPAATSFTASYTINAGAPVNELITLGSSLTSHSAMTYTFTTQANLSVPGTYSFNATVSLAGDISPANDAFNNYAVTNSAHSAGGTVVATPPSSSSGTLTLNGNTGNVVQWEESDDGGQRWFVLSDETTSQPFANLRTTAQFRARLRNGSCPEALSTIATVTP
jgi:hypothetical protein